MDGLNYHHLQYFWLVAKEGSIAKAAARLKVSQPTISTQLKRLDADLGTPLFQKRGRNLELTPAGERAFEYADRIFTLGHELGEMLNGRTVRRPLPLNVGVTPGLPATVVDQLLRPAFHLAEPVQLVSRTTDLLSLAGELVIGRLDVVLTDRLLDASVRLPVVIRPLLEAGVVLRGRDDLVQRLRRGFPKSLTGAPLLLPGPELPLRRLLDGWFAEHRLRPEVVAESDDAALLEAWGQAGLGLYPTPQVSSGVSPRSTQDELGPLPDLTMTYHALLRDEPVSHPALAALFAAVAAE
jgi:LysR family transcriptional activator of nhaA